MYIKGKNLQWNENTGIFEEIKVKEKTKNFYGETCTDRSRYKPNVNELVQIADFNGNLSEGNYMFKDGKDNGIRLYGLTNPALDVTERQKWVDSIKEEGNLAKEEINTMLEEMKTQEELNEEKIDNSANSLSNNTNAE